MSDVRRDGLSPRSYQCSGPAPGSPGRVRRSALSSRACLSSRSARSASSLSVRNALSPNSTGRSKGTLTSSSVVQTPCRSGSPHGVRGAVQAFATAASFAVAVGAWPAAGVDRSDATMMTAISVLSATRHRRLISNLFSLLLVGPHPHSRARGGASSASLRRATPARLLGTPAPRALRPAQGVVSLSNHASRSHFHLVVCLRRCPYSSSSANGMHLNSKSWTFLSIRRYRGMLIFQGRVNTFESSIVTS